MTDNKSKINQLEEALDRVSKRQKVCVTKSIAQIDQLISELTKAKVLLNPEKMDTGLDINTAQVIQNLQNKVQEIDPVNKVASEHKDFHAAISKYGKAIDKSFTVDTAKSEDAVQFDHTVLNSVLAQHFFRQGKFEIGNMFIQEANLQIDSSLKEPFVEMYKILDAMLNQRNLLPAIEWASTRRKELQQKQQSGLEFNLHRLQFIHLVCASKRDEAIKYARQNFVHFATTHMKDIQKLMGSLLYIGRLDKSPYSSFLSPNIWNDISYDFTSACCALLGLSYESPLYTCVTAGTLALPKQMKVASLLQSKNLKIQQIEYDLGPEFHFHPVFACPVTREQSSQENPPMLLTCGHVISKVSMNKLARPNTTKIKCPYCPTDQTTQKAIQITF